MATDLFRTGSLTDVAGIHLGHHQRRGRGWRTGTTAVIAPRGVIAACDVRGGGPGTRETAALAPGNLVERIHGVCLSGGSAYGLAAADGVVAELERRRLGVRVGDDPAHVVPVVPAAIIFDLGRGGRFENRPDASFGERAAQTASRTSRRGAIGAGTGAIAGGLQGGIGMCSTTVAVGSTTATVAALVVNNAVGDVIDRATGLPFVGVDGLRRPAATERRSLEALIATRHTPPLNTVLAVVATDAAITSAEASRLGAAAHDGIARAVRPAHTLRDGDVAFVLSTGDVALTNAEHGGGPLGDRAATRVADLVRVHAAATDVVATAAIDAVLSARAAGDALAYRDVCPSAYRAIVTTGEQGAADRAVGPDGPRSAGVEGEAAGGRADR